MTLNEMLTLLPVSALRDALEGQTWDTLTDGETTKADIARRAACAWALGKVQRCGHGAVADEDLLREALRKRGIYELYALHEVEASASDKRADAEDAIVALLGECARDGARAPSGISVSRDPCLPKRRWPWSF